MSYHRAAEQGYASAQYVGHAATKPDEVNILLCDINKRLIMM